MELIPGDSFNNVGTITYDQFRRECSGFELAGALGFIQCESAAMGNQILKKLDFANSVLGSGHTYISQETHAFLGKHLLLNSSYLHRRPFGRSDYENLAVYFNHLETDLNYLDPDNPNAQRWLVRASYTQGRYQRIPGQVLGRYHILFRKLGESSQVCRKMAQEAMGLDVTEFMLIGISFYAIVLCNKLMDVRAVENHSIPSLSNVLLPEKLTRFLQVTSISQSTFRNECSHWGWNNRLLKKYEFNPLWLFPIIDTGILNPGSRYIVPSLSDLAYRFTEGIYYSTMDYYNQGGKKNEFSANFGLLFEKYVGYLLHSTQKSNANLGAIQPEMEYSVGKDRWRSADWLLVSANNVIQIECKKITTPLKFRAAISDDSGNSFYAVLNEFANYVVKLYKKSTHIRQGNLDLNSGETANVLSLFVVMDDFYFVDSRFKSLVTAIASQREPSISQEFHYHILSCTGFEILCEFMRTHPDIRLSDVLESKQQREHYYTDFAQFLERSFDFSCSEVEVVWKASDELWNLAT
jgi:hypothetical protein